MVPGVPSGDRGNWDKNRGATSAMHMFCEESLGKITAKMSIGPQTRSLESVDYFGTYFPIVQFRVHYDR